MAYHHLRTVPRIVILQVVYSPPVLSPQARCINDCRLTDRDDRPIRDVWTHARYAAARKAHKEGKLDELGDKLGGILGDREFVNRWLESRKGGGSHRLSILFFSFV